MLFNKELKKRLGTNFYNIALHTKEGFVTSGKLVRAMIDTLPDNVNLYENSSLLDWKKKNDTFICKFKNGSIKTKKIIFATNGFLRSLGIKSNYNFQLL